MTQIIWGAVLAARSAWSTDDPGQHAYPHGCHHRIAADGQGQDRLGQRDRTIGDISCLPRRK